MKPISINLKFKRLLAMFLAVLTFFMSIDFLVIKSYASILDGFEVSISWSGQLI